MSKEKICGIYCIENIINGKKYIGQSIDVEERRYHHFNSLKNGTHHNMFLQNEYNVYGKENFIFYIIIECCKDLLDYYEILYIQKLNLLDRNFGYNINPGGSDPHSFSDAELQKRSDSIKKKWEEMDDEKREYILKSLQDGYIKWFKSMSADDRYNIYKRRSEKYFLKPQEEKDTINKKRSESIKNTVKNRSEQRIEELKTIYRAASKRRWENTPNEIKEMLRKSVMKSVYCPELDIIFESVKAASIFSGVPSSNIVKVCRGDRRYAGKLEDGTELTWKYVKDK